MLFIGQMVLLATQWSLFYFWCIKNKNKKLIDCASAGLFILYIIDIWDDHQWYMDWESIIAIVIIVSSFLPSLLTITFAAKVNTP